MLPSHRSESLNAISNSLADLHLSSSTSTTTTTNDGLHRNLMMKSRGLRSSKTSDCLISNKNSALFATNYQSSPKPLILAGGVKKHARHNFSFSNAKFHDIQRENRRLLGEILKKTTSLPTGIRQRPKRPSSTSSFSPILTSSVTRNPRRGSAPNTNAVSFYVRQKERQRIEMENLALHRRLQSIKTGSTNGVGSYLRDSRSGGRRDLVESNLKRSSSVPRFLSSERLDHFDEPDLADENVSSFEI